MNKLFVYGTLRYGGGANHLLCECTLLQKKVKLSFYSLFDHGLYPFAVKSSNINDFILGDIYEVTNEDLTVLDEYEGEMYERLWDQKNKIFIYVKNDGITTGHQQINSGDWLNYKLKL